MICEDIFGVNPLIQKRKKQIVECRHAVCYLIRTYTQLSLTDIARVLGRTEHTTVINAITNVRNWIETDEWYRNMIEKCVKEIDIFIEN